MKNRSCSSDRSFTGPSADSFTRAFARPFTGSFAVFCAFVTALPYTATTMRLLRYEGTVEIEDSAGKQRPVMENARLNSGEAMKTGEASSASVGLDKGRIVTLDALSRVEFEKKAGALSMNLTEGSIFLDVSEKLDTNETMDVKTSTMVVGIRGTIIYVSNEPVTDEAAADLRSVDLEGLAPEKGSIVRLSQLGVLEGTAQITYTDNAGQEQALSVDAGKKAIVPEYSEDAEGIPAPKVEPITQEDLQGFVLNQITADDSVYKRVDEACESLDLNGLSGIYTADGDWTWDSPVTLVAQSASKYYDGQPLTRTSDILVNGLPNIFTVKASAGGSRTDAGESDNPVSNYTIYNKAGQDVTRHFTNIQTVSGTLLIIPAPLTIHTGTAEKVYDGTPLTDKEAYVTFYKGSDNREVPWRNTSYVVTESTGSVSYDNQTLYGICGTIWVNAANPLTGERREIRLKAGQKLSVFLSDQDGKQSIELKIENLTINDLPEELLRLYGDNEALLAQACKDTGWDIELLKKRIEALPETPSGTATIEQGGLMIRESESDRLMQNLTNVRITIDTEITDYNNRALGSEEAHYTSLSVDESIKVTPTGSQTNAGTSINTYTIDWGSADRGNYEVSEDLGTLTVTAASATVTTGSAQKAYDGTPLTNSEASISGLVNGETASVTATGSITNVGSTANTYSIRWGSADSGNYSVSEDLGTLRVTAPVATVTLTAASAEKTYDGTPLTDSTFTVEGLPAGYTATATVSGSQTDAGSSDNTVTSFKIYNASGTDVTGQFKEVTTVKGTLTVYPAPAEVSTGSATKEYDGTPLNGSELPAPETPDSETPGSKLTGPGVSITGIASADEGQVTVTATGSITDIGTAENTYSIDWGSAKSSNYTLSENLGTLEVTANDTEITFTAGSGSKVYDGYELVNRTVTVEGLPSGFSTVTETSGSQTDVGTSANTLAFYHITKDGAGEGEADVTAYFTNIKTVDGTLEVTPAAATVTTDSAEKKYDGTPLNGSDLPDSGASITGLAGTDESQVTVTATGSITDIGTAENTYSIDWGSTKSSNYTLSENLGTLEITANDTEITFTSASAEKVYDGTALIAHDVTVEGLPDGLTYKCTAGNTFGVVGAGTYENYFDDIEYSFKDEGGNTVVGWRNAEIYDADGNDVTDKFTNLNFVTGTLTIKPAELVVKTGSDEKTYDGTALTNSEASVTGAVSADEGQISVTANGTITDAGTESNTYTISWGSANSGNYTVSEQLGILTVNKLPVEFNMFFPKEVIDDVETDPTFVYDGSAHSPEWSRAYYEGMGDGLDPNDWNVDGDDYSFTFLLPGGGKLQLTGSGYSNAGTHTFEPAASFLEGSAGNYELSFVDNSIVIEPVELVLISNDTYAVTSDVYISEYGLKVQVNNLESDYYEVVTTGENEWRISFYWGDKIDVSKILIKDGNTFSITPIYDVVSGDPANYDIETVDQEGTMTEPIYIDPEDLYGSILISKASSLLAPTTEEEADAEDDADADADTGAGADTDADADAEDTGSGEGAGENSDEKSGEGASGEGSIEGSSGEGSIEKSGEGSSGEGSIENSTGSTDGGSSDEKISADPTASEQTQDADEELKEDSQKEDPQAEQPQAAEPQEEETEAEEPQEEASPTPQTEEPQEVKESQEVKEPPVQATKDSPKLQTLDYPTEIRKPTPSGNRLMAKVYMSSAMTGNQYESYGRPDIYILGVLTRYPNYPNSSYSNLAVLTEHYVHHRQPVRFGLSLRYRLTDCWSVESGLSYTRLSSDITTIILNETTVTEQRLNYIGLPLNISYELWRSRYFGLYLSGGSTIEKCLNASPWQFSLNGAAGAEYKLTDFFSLYAEPGIGYYFKDGSSTPTIYKDHPLNFNLSFGLRLNLK